MVDDYEMNDSRGDPALLEQTNKRYETTYSKFIEWSKNNNVIYYTENIFLKYFSEQAKIVKAGSLYSNYSMLKSRFLMKHGLNMSKFSKLTEFIKKQNTGYIPQKSSIFSKEDINKFLSEASNGVHLMHKVCLILGVEGRCRLTELKNMLIDDIQDKEDILIVTVPDSKTGKKRIFTVTNRMYDCVNPVDIYRQYVSLRPSHTPHRRLFIFYRAGRCTIQQVGVHTIGKVPKIIATYLKLHDVDSYTGHAFRGSSKLLLDKKTGL